VGALDMTIEYRGRKSFSGAGRKRKAGPREPNGRVQRPTATERESNIKGVVLGQPHRQGSDDIWRETPIGRLLLSGKVAHSSATSAELWRASQEYLAAFGNIRRVWDSRRPYAVAVGTVPPDLSEDQKARYQREWGDIERVLRDAGVMSKKAVEYILQDAPPDDEERAYSHWVTYGAGIGLAAIAKHFEII
jgi:hypothetical protein